MSLRKGIGFCQQSDSHNCGYFFYLPGKIQISKCSMSYQNKRISMATINKTTAKYRVLIFSPNLSEFNSGCASSSSNRFFAILSSQLIVTST